MTPLSEAIIAILTPFAPLFTRPVWGHVQVLLIGAILCRGPRTVASVLRVMGLGDEKRFEKYHREPGALVRLAGGEDFTGFAGHAAAAGVAGVGGY